MAAYGAPGRRRWSSRAQGPPVPSVRSAAGGSISGYSRLLGYSAGFLDEYLGATAGLLRGGGGGGSDRCLDVQWGRMRPAPVHTACCACRWGNLKNLRMYGLAKTLSVQRKRSGPTHAPPHPLPAGFCAVRGFWGCCLSVVARFPPNAPARLARRAALLIQFTPAAPPRAPPDRDTPQAPGWACRRTGAAAQGAAGLHAARAPHAGAPPHAAPG